MSNLIDFWKRTVASIVAVRYQLLKYSITGSLTFIIDYGIFTILYSLLNTYYLLAAAISQAAALLFNFTFQKKWTFNAHGNTKNQLLRYVLLQMWNYGFSLLALFVLVDIEKLNTLIAKLITVGIIVTWNFLAYKFIVYRTN